MIGGAALAALALAAGWAGLRGTAPVAAPRMAHGVVFFCPAKAGEAVAELERIRAQGYRLIEFASWVWTLPTAGSELERTAGAVLDWCDAHDMRFVLMHNIQLGSAGEGGALDDAATDPLRAARLLTDWLRTLRGHPCVAGVILGNEVGPVIGSRRETPGWWAAFTAAMRAHHRTIGRLNAAWGTRYGDFGEMDAPPPGSPGRTDLERFAADVFHRFYGALLERAVRPPLAAGRARGETLLLGCKMAGDPLLHAACGSFSMICWDDVLSDYPQWRLKALGDLARRSGRPVFNSELHLYHDTYAFAPSAAKSRYRYLLSALNNEWLTASFAWGQWSKPGVAEIHGATAGILAELGRLEPALRRLAGVRPTLHALITPGMTADDAAMQRLYSRLAGPGAAWEFVCPEELSGVRDGTLLVPTGARLGPDALRALTAAPRGVRVALDAPADLADEYGRRLAGPAAAALRRRSARAVASANREERLGPPYSQAAEVSYVAWSEKRGHYAYPLAYPRLEARRTELRRGERLVAVINHATSGDPVRAQLPWVAGAAEVRELTGLGGRIDGSREMAFAPLSVRVFRYRERDPGR